MCRDTANNRYERRTDMDPWWHPLERAQGRPEARHFTLGQTIEPRPTRVHFISEGEHLVYETFDAVRDVAAATEAQLEAWLKRAQRQ
jgi:hypothetical protein